jgi:spermidine synthase
MPRHSESRSLVFPLALSAFFASGFAALLYQVIWQRLLVLFSGVDIHSVTMIVASFMVGLGFGSLLGGVIADRLGARASLWAFAAAELAIGLYGLSSKVIYYDLLYTRLPHLAANSGTAAAVLMATLLVPTFSMGLSLPLLARALTRSIHAAGGVIGSLYGLNTLGAAFGAFIGTWVLLPQLGLERALWVGAFLNFLCAGIAVVIARIEAKAAAPEPAEPASPMQEEGFEVATLERRLPFPFWATIFGFTGFLALALEIVWFRLLGVMLKSTSFTFGTLLGIYLAGLGIGAALAARKVGRSRYPGSSFLSMQYAITVYVGVSIIVLLAMVGAGYPAGLVRHFGGNEPFDLASAFAIFVANPELGEGSARRFLVFLFVYGFLPAALIGPPTILMGFSFPYLQKASLESVGGLGRRVGVLMASNITGATLGTMAAGWLLLPNLGTAGTLKLLVALGLVLVGALLRIAPRRGSGRERMAAATAAVATVVIVLAMPGGRTLWARLHAAEPADVIYAEDGSGLSLLRSEEPGFSGTVMVFVNGLSQSRIPFGGVHTALGALPVLLHPAPNDVALIGLGSGDTVFSAAARHCAWPSWWRRSRSSATWSWGTRPTR